MSSKDRRSEGREDLADLLLLPQPPFSSGFLVCLPLFLLYELGVARDFPRNVAELALSRPFAFLGGGVAPLRWVLLLAAGLFALWIFLREEEDAARRLGREIAEGVLAGVLLGPLLMGLLALSEAWPGGEAFSTARDPLSLLGASRLVGGAAWEELVFRVGGHGLVFLVVARATRFLGLAPALAGPTADLAALLFSSLFFAAFHLAFLQRWLGAEGTAFSGPIFLWRLLAGMLLCALYRWRGLGVAAWGHGVFNLILALGAGPGAFR